MQNKRCLMTSCMENLPSYEATQAEQVGQEGGQMNMQSEKIGQERGQMSMQSE